MRFHPSKREKIESAIAGEGGIRARTVWTHLVTEHLNPIDAARIHLKFQSRYDWDLLKIMHDVRLRPPSDGADRHAAELCADWAASLTLDDSPFAYQLELIAVVVQETQGRVPVVETVFSPVQSLGRAVGADTVARLVQDEPTAFEETVRSLASLTEWYIQRLADLGCYGIFYAPGGLAENDPVATSPEEYKKWFATFDSAILEMAERCGMRRLIHMHGSNLVLDRCRDLSGEVWNWAYYQTPPDVDDWATAKSGAVIGGVRHDAIVNRSRREIWESINGFLDQARGAGIIGPGCAVPGSVSSVAYDAIRDYPGRGQADHSSRRVG